MASKLKRPTRREMFFIFAAACLFVVPEFILKAAALNITVFLQLAVLFLLACCLAAPFWFFYRIFLKGRLRARHIQRIREERLMREIMEERESNRD